MNKYAFQQKLEDIDLLVSEGKYAEAVDEADELNLDLVTQPRRLQTIAKAYERCHRFSDAEELLLQAREYAPKSRSILFHLCSVATKSGALDMAKAYYQEFQNIAPYDSERLILLYRIGQASGAGSDDLIAILEEYKTEEPDDRWMYELAVLYAESGDIGRAVQICDEITLWFYSGKYVLRANELKAKLTGVPIARSNENEHSMVTPVNISTHEHSEAYEDNDEAEPISAYRPSEPMPQAAEPSAYQAAEASVSSFALPEEAAEAETPVSYPLPAAEAPSASVSSYHLPTEDSGTAAAGGWTQDLSEMSADAAPSYEMWADEVPSGETKIAPSIGTAGNGLTNPAPAAEALPASAPHDPDDDIFNEDLFSEPEFITDDENIIDPAVFETDEPAAPAADPYQPVPETIPAMTSGTVRTGRVTEEIVFDTPELLAEDGTFRQQAPLNAASLFIKNDRKPAGAVIGNTDTEPTVSKPAAGENAPKKPESIETVSAADRGAEDDISAVIQDIADDMTEPAAEPEDRPIPVYRTDDHDEIGRNRSEERFSEALEAFVETPDDLGADKEPETGNIFTFDSVSGTNADEVAAAEELLKVREEMAVTPESWQVISFSEDGQADVSETAVDHSDAEDAVLAGDFVMPDVQPVPEAVEAAEAANTIPDDSAVAETAEEHDSLHELIQSAEERRPQKNTDHKAAEAREKVRDRETKPAADERTPKTTQTEAKNAGKKDDFDLDVSFDPDSAAARVAQEIMRRKSEEAKFGGLPLEPDIVRKKIWHFMVFGETDALTLECAREKMKEIADENPNSPKKMLKINAKKIGDANIIHSLDRFLGNMVIVQQASLLSDEQLEQFNKVLDRDDQSLLVAFTDTKAGLSAMFDRVPDLDTSFTGVYEGKKYTAKDLLDVAEEYLYTQDARLTDDGRDAVLAEALRLLNERSGFYKNNIKLFAENGLEKADRGGFLGLGSGKTDKEGYLLVAAKHFKS